MIAGKQWLAVAIPLGAGLAMEPAVLSGRPELVAVLSGALGLRAPSLWTVPCWGTPLDYGLLAPLDDLPPRRSLR